MRRLRGFFGTAFGAGVAVCLVLAGWALISGGIFDSGIARQARVSSYYAAPGYDVDQTAAEKILGNRRLVVILLAEGDSTRLRDVCDDVEGAAEGNLVLVLRPDGADLDGYGCAFIPGRDDENFGKAAVSETMISAGLDSFVDRPLDALKVIAVNYDRLVRGDFLPDGARTISPSFPRFVVAGTALGAVVLGSVVLNVASRRAGRSAAGRRIALEGGSDRRSVLNARTAVLAGQIIELDNRVGAAVTAGSTRRKRQKVMGPADEYRAVVADFTDLMATIAGDDAAGDTGGNVELRIRQAQELEQRCHELAGRLPISH
ncbi:hypothetical protein D1871_03230 [Nakamurella silvestris]|nr:hypothetical protein D1871_03230 [Nakamurella silvestris]